MNSEAMDCSSDTETQAARSDTPPVSREAAGHYERLIRATNSFAITVQTTGGITTSAISFPGCEQITGYRCDEFQQDRNLWERILWPADRDLLRQAIAKLSAGEPVAVAEHRIIHRDGQPRWVRQTLVPRQSPDGDCIGYDGLISDITALKQTEAERDALTQQLRHMALHDPLTGLLNRRGLEERLNQLWEVANSESTALGLLVLDIDHFKSLNDTYGHGIGDRVLAESAALIQAALGEAHVVCRLGGDEMVVILPNAPPAATRASADRILTLFRQHQFLTDDQNLRITVSIGAASITPTVAHTADRFLAQADQALYQAKQSGRNTVCVA